MKRTGIGLIQQHADTFFWEGCGLQGILHDGKQILFTAEAGRLGSKLTFQVESCTNFLNRVRQDRRQ